MTAPAAPVAPKITARPSVWRSTFRNAFRLRGTLPPVVERFVAPTLGFAVFVGVWHLLAYVVTDVLHKRGIIPTPLAVGMAFGPLLKAGIVFHTIKSIELNVLGYVEAVAAAVPLAFVLGLFPLPRAMVERLLASVRGLPLPALTGVFILAFGIGTSMKAHFLALGIFVYLLPTIMGRVLEVPEVYDQTARTLGATPWQRIWTVYVPHVLPRAFFDIAVLTPISWTYITIAEVINSAEGGLGAVGYRASQTGHVDQTYAILLIIIGIIWVQDTSFKLTGRYLFPYLERT